MKEVNLTLCSCNKYLDKNQWKPYGSIEKLVSDKVKKQVPKGKVEVKTLELPHALKEKKKHDVIVKVKKDEKVVPVVLKLAKCNLCEKEGTLYFEAILQIRSPNFDVLDKSVNFLQKRVENLRHKGMFINRTERLDDGYDLYVTSRKIAMTLGKELQEQYGGEFRASPQLFSRNKQTSKNIYRVNVLVRLPEFEKGDILLYDEKIFRVDKLGSKIKLQDLMTNNFTVADYSKMKYAVLKKYTTYVSRTHPYLEVINPFDFQSSMVKNRQINSFELGQEIKVAVHKGIYVVE
jgi:nonsense-mediated mRNA decay protein 3